MPTKTKIKIADNAALRKVLDAEYEKRDQIQICKYALLLAEHVLNIVNYEYGENSEIAAGFAVNKQWQRGSATMHEVRQAGFKIHKTAKENGNPAIKTALRVVGQAVASGHMKEHAMVASDYAVKVINLLSPDDAEAVTRERLWQIDCLKAVK